MRLDGVERGRLGDGVAVDIGFQGAVVIAARAQRDAQPGGQGLRALQQRERVPLEGLGLLEFLNQFFEIGLHALVSRNGERQLASARLRATHT